MYEVKNITKDVRRLIDSGRAILVEPGESVKVRSPPEERGIWKVKGKEKKEEKKTKKITEEDNHDS